MTVVSAAAKYLKGDHFRFLWTLVRQYHYLPLARISRSVAQLKRIPNSTFGYKQNISLLFSRIISTHGWKLFKYSRSGCLLTIAFLQYKGNSKVVEAAAAPVKASDLQRFLAELDRLHTSGLKADAYNRLRSALETGDPAYQCADVYWRLARGAYAMSKECTGSDRAEMSKAHAYEAFSMAQRGLAMDPSSWACHMWMGILLDLTGRYEGTKKRIQNSYQVKEHFSRAVEGKPDNATVLHCLGSWCYEVADLPWYQRKLAAALFATPPTSSYDEALVYLLKAEEVDPNFYSTNLLYIGKAYLKKGDSAKARSYLQRAVEYKGDSVDDKQAREEAAKLLSSF